MQLSKKQIEQMVSWLDWLQHYFVNCGHTTKKTNAFIQTTCVFFLLLSCWNQPHSLAMEFLFLFIIVFLFLCAIFFESSAYSRYGKQNSCVSLYSFISIQKINFANNTENLQFQFYYFIKTKERRNKVTTPSKKRHGMYVAWPHTYTTYSQRNQKSKYGIIRSI